MRPKPSSVVVEAKDVSASGEKRPMRDSGIVGEKGTEKGAVRKESCRPYEGTRETERKVEKKERVSGIGR